MAVAAPVETAARITPLEPIELDPKDFPPTNVGSIPPLAKHWQQLDFREILSRPAAFLSVSQSNSVYKPGGVQYAEGHAFRGSLEATVKAVKAARAAKNFVSFNWIGYSVFRDDYPKTDFDRVQYAGWTGHIDATPEQIAWDNELVPELRELVRPGDNELFETALQTAFVGTDLPGRLARHKGGGDRADRNPPGLVHRGQCPRRTRPRAAADRHRGRHRCGSPGSGTGGLRAHQQLLRAGDHLGPVRGLAPALTAARRTARAG